MIDYTNIEYLKDGSSIQKKSYEILKELEVLDYLKEYTPILTGTIPIGINIEKSDLDIVCNVKDFTRFIEKVGRSYSRFNSYKIAKTKENIVINFFYKKMEIEIYGADKDSLEQNAYRHMVVEAKLLEVGGERLKKKIIELKRNGLKTELAFCKALKVEGNPYENMLDEDRMLENIEKIKK